MSARLLLHTLRCPACGLLPIGIIGPTQAICGNDDCRALFFNPGRTVADQMGDVHEISLGGDADTAGGIELPAPPQPLPVGDPAELAAEYEIRESFHARGYVCADGLCPVCGPYVNDGE